jgi:hypothetical protein
MPKAIVIGALECTGAHMREMDAMIAKMTDKIKKKEAATG